MTRRLLNALFLFLLALPIFAHAQPSRAVFIDNEADVANMRWDLVEKEKTEIIASYFLWDGNKVGQAHMAALRAAAKRGVKVTVVIDGNFPEGWGSTVGLVDKEVTPAQMKSLQDAGVDVRIYNPVGLKTELLKTVNKYTTLKAAYRSHDKLLILGGGKLLATGDRNAQNINFRRRNSGGMQGKSYRSAETLVAGPAAAEARTYVEDLLKTPDCTVPNFSRVTPEEVEKENRNFDRIERVMRDSKHVAQDWEAKLKPVDGIKFLSDVPGDKGGSFGQEQQFIDAINAAKKSVTIVSPYVHLTPEFEEAVAKARGRGVQVRVVTAARNITDAPIMSIVFEPQAAALQAMGVEVYMHTGPDFMHSKMMEVDGEMAYVGSYNFSYRSRYHDLESGVMIRGKDYVDSIRAFHEMLIHKESIPYRAPEKSFTTWCGDALTRMIINSSATLQRNF